MKKILVYLVVLFPLVGEAYTVTYLSNTYVAIGNNGRNYAYDGSNESAADAVRNVESFCPGCVVRGGSACCATAISYTYGRNQVDFAVACAGDVDDAAAEAVRTCQNRNQISCSATGAVCARGRRID